MADTSTLVACKDCGETFELTIGERIFFDSRELAYPKRCKPCRAAKRAANEARPDWDR